MKRLTIAFAVIATMLAMTPVGTSASAPLATIQIENQAQLLANGSVVLKIDYSCNPDFFGSSGSLSTLVQQPGRGGFGSIQAVCDDTKHTVAVTNSPGPFTPGSASARADLFSGTSNFSATAQAEVMVK